MILEQKIKREYDLLDRLVSDKAAIEGQVHKGLVVKRNETRQRIDRLKIMIQRMHTQIQETRIHQYDLKAQIQVID
jgi:hypothetical protein